MKLKGTDSAAMQDTGTAPRWQLGRWPARSRGSDEMMSPLRTARSLSVNWRRCRVLQLLVIAAVFVVIALHNWSVSGQALQRPTLFVFLNTEMKPNVLQQTLQHKLPAIEVTVFGRYKDFEKSATTLRPDAVLALRPVIEGFGLNPALQGTSAESTEETYVLLAIDRQLTAPELPGLTIGSVDLMGRARMPRFVGDVLGLSGEAKVKLVTKTEDLLPLLQFHEADAVLLPERQSQLLVGKSELVLKKFVAAKKVSLPALAVPTPAGQAILGALRQLDPATTRSLGMEGWK